MNLKKIIKEELLPLSSRQNLILIVIISCFFQFALFYTPALADEAVNQAKAESNKISEEAITGEDLLVKNDSIQKNEYPDETVLNLIGDLTDDNLLEIFQDELKSNTDKADPSRRLPSAETKPHLLDENGELLEAVKTSVHVITAYNSEAAQTDDSPCITANGFNICEHGKEDTIAANFLSFGTKVQIPELFGDRVFIVRDRMNKKHSNRIDVWMKEKSDAIQFGARTARIYILE